MQELKPFDKESIPDMGQKHWVHTNRMELCKGLGFWPTLLIVGGGSVVVATLAMTSWWVFYNYRENSWVDGAASILLFLAVAVGFVVIGFVSDSALSALQQRRLRRTIPPCPANYSPEMAEAANYHEYNVKIFNERLEKALKEAEALPEHAEEICAEIARFRAYQDAISEEDMDEFTLSS